MLPMKIMTLPEITVVLQISWISMSIGDKKLY